MRALRDKLRKPFQWTNGRLLLAAGVVGLLCSMSLLATVIFGLLVIDQGRQLNDTQNAQIKANADATRQAKTLARALAPSDKDLAAGASRALEVCLRTPSCRDSFRGAIRRARLRPQDVPNLVPDPSDTTGSGSGGRNGSGSEGNGSGSGGGTAGSDTTPPTSAQPSPSRPPAARPPAARPPAPSPAVPPSSPSVPSTPPPATSTPPAVRPPVTPPVTTPTVPPIVTVPTTPTVPPPVLPPICIGPIKINCRDVKSGKVVGPEGHAADPNSNSGRGNESVPLCERIKAPCDDQGNPVFPSGLIRLP